MGAFQLHFLRIAEPAYPELHPYLNKMPIDMLTPFYVLSTWRKYGGEIIPVRSSPLMFHLQNYH
jgi:hypothetical protein